MGADNPTYHRIVGNTDIAEISRRSWNQTDGVSSQRRYRGTADKIQEKFNELSTSGTGVDELDEDIEGKAGHLVARILEDSGSSGGGNTEELNAVWELYASELNKPVEAHTDFDSVTTIHKRAIEKAAREGEGIPAIDPSGAAWTPSTAEKQLYAWYAVQVLDFVLTELELHKTTILTTKSAIVASYTGMNTVTGLPSDVPGALLGVLTSLPKMDGSSGAWQWLKLCPQLRQVSKRKFQLSYRWRGAERWASLYDNGSWTPTYT